VLVIFLFLRNVSATAIPSVALPMSIVGTFVVMYLLGYSLDNRSLMALTLSVGFVVDDAIVMLENIVRHMEMGEGILEAAYNGSVKVHVEVQRPTKALDEGDRACLRRERSGASGAQALMSEDRAQRDVERARDELRVAGEQEARPARQREDPLAHRHARDHPVHEVGRGVVHPAGGTRWAEAAPLGRGDRARNARR